jgi:hypothetical protein
MRADGTAGCSVPCILCRRALEVFDLKISCCTVERDTFTGRIHDAPPSKLTHVQERRVFGRV